jgi:hypothetical protein
MLLTTVKFTGSVGFGLRRKLPTPARAISHDKVGG